jgi:probable lipoprotein NlpC
MNIRQTSNLVRTTQRKLIRIISYILIPIFIFGFSISDLSAEQTKQLKQQNKSAQEKKKKKRRYRRKKFNPEKTREMSIDLIRSSSSEVTELAGLEPIVPDSLSQLSGLDSLSQGEILDDGCEMPQYEEGEDTEELELEDDVTVDMESFKMLWLAYVDDGEGEDFTDAGVGKQEIMDAIMDWLGTPYRFGGTTERAIDCSAFVRAVFKESAEITLPRTANYQYKVGQKIKRKDLVFGDMIFFHTRRYARATHVGIYLGDDLFAHASSRYGVTVSSLESTYYKKRFIGGRRLRAADIARYDNKKDLITQ